MVRFFQRLISVNICIIAMSEKLCLQWNDFKENVNTAFGNLRDDKDFSDVTLACEDGYQMEAHKVILAASSPFFQDLLKKIKHPHPMIYLRGFQTQDLVAMVDFLYFGEANVCQENLDSFLAIAEELKLKGLTGQHSEDLMSRQDGFVKPVPPNKGKSDPPRKATASYEEPLGTDLVSKDQIENESRALSLPGQFSTDLLALDEKVKSMMTKSQNMIQRKANGKLRQATAVICKVCGMEGRLTNIRNHIEANHLEAITIPCNLCDTVLTSRNTLAAHKSMKHKNHN